jgi:bifunctional non-homologous end joining protein LigD
VRALEFCCWAGKVDSLEMPEMIAFDLDPWEGATLKCLRQEAHGLRNALAGLSLQSSLKTSGVKGCHVALPFLPAAGKGAHCRVFLRAAELIGKRRHAYRMECGGKR